ncbi:MAG: DUF2312 domain-containing protein [Rickettsiales bacterium]|jgi:uncharacterized protein (UPF0335 family)|nr:DUF2312 domain-containing protein [Rickettsiales bacterium]
MAEIDLKLKQVVENIEHLEDEKKEISDQITAVYKEAAGLGFDVKVLRKIISLRKKDINEVKEEEDLLELYKKSLGML